jgi:hypothetical protein
MVQLLGEVNYIDNVRAKGVDRRMGNIAPTNPEAVREMS